jgi:hypothetical protein
MLNNLDPELEKKYDRIRWLGQDLHVPVPEAFWELKVLDGDGKTIQQLKQRARSWVRNAYNMLANQALSVNNDGAVYGPGSLRQKDVTGTERSGSGTCRIGSDGGGEQETTAAGFCQTAGTQRGIVVGSSAAAWTFNDYMLGSIIGHGMGAGQLTWQSCDLLSKSYVGLVYTANWLRYFNNNSGGDVTVNEVGIYVYCSLGGGQNVLLARDVTGAPVVIPNTGQLNVTYTIQITFPA